MKKDLVRLKSLVKRKKRSVLNKLVDFFIHSQYQAYLVGGYIRDLALGCEPVDIDLVVEGDSIEAAKRLNARLRGRLLTHKQFGTASIITRHGIIDLASARRESYPAPAALPKVQLATIIEDLNRRDFTINAVAMSLARTNLGEIFDPFNGLDDLKNGRLRILHKNSFIDDPTRIFRLIRYKNRFGFRIEYKTAKLMEEAITRGVIKKLSGQRILNELKLVFAEPTYYKSIKDISRLGIFHIRRRNLQRLPMMNGLRLYYYCAHLELDLPLSRPERSLLQDLRRIDQIAAELARAQKRSKIYNILDQVNKQITQTIPSIFPELRSKVEIYKALSEIKPLVKGDDLKRLGVKPGPKFKSLLKKAFERQLDHGIKRRKDALKILDRI